LDGDHWKSTTFPTFAITFITTTTNIGRFTNWTANKESGNLAFFCSG
jgi:hypothetical protein